MDRTGFFHSPYSEQTEKQSKHDILIGKFQDTAVKGKIKGNFRDQGKEKKAEGIFLQGIGKPEPLKHRPGYSRRIDEANRLVYDIDELQNIVILSCRGHYED